MLRDLRGIFRMSLKHCHASYYPCGSGVSIWHPHSWPGHLLLYFWFYSQLSMWSRVCICVCVLMFYALLYWRLRLFWSRTSTLSNCYIFFRVQGMSCFKLFLWLRFCVMHFVVRILLNVCLFVLAIVLNLYSMSISQFVFCHPHMSMAIGLYYTFHVVYR